MQLKQVLSAVPGLPKRFIYYLESAGYIQPTKVPKARIARRDYSVEDLRLVRSIWRYYQRGFSLQHAYRLATKESRVATYVALAVPPRLQRQVIERLRAHEDVASAAAVYGDSFGLIAKWQTAEEEEVYPFLVSFLREAGLTSIPAVWKVDERFRRPHRDGPQHQGTKGVLVRAFVLLKIPGTSADRILKHLKDFPGIVEASVVYGETDIIAKVEAASQDELDRLVMEQIHGISGVESTRTYIVIGDLHWSRQEP